MGLVDLQQEHLGEAAGQLLLVVRTAADVQRRRRFGPDQLVEAGRIPCPAVPGKPGQVRHSRLFRHHRAGRVNEPRKQRIVNHARHVADVEAGRYIRKGSRRRSGSGPGDGESPLF